MKIAIYAPDPTRNLFLRGKYFNQLMIMGIDRIMDLDSAKECVILIHSEDLTPELIISLKDRKNKIVSFDINDSSWFTYTYAGRPEMMEIDLIFKIAAIWRTNVVDELAIDSNFAFSKVQTTFMPEKEWDQYDQLYRSGKMKPLPNMPWNLSHFNPMPFSARKRMVAVRGGLHFLRYVLYLKLLSQGLTDHGSEFMTHHYLHQFCQDCVDEIRDMGAYSYDRYASKGRFPCTNHRDWQGEIDQRFFNVDRGAWNNRCIPMHYWLAGRFSEQNGPIDLNTLEHSLNGKIGRMNFLNILPMYLFYGDFKWAFSIDAPQRFWEAAEAGTISFLPKRAAMAEYFPHMEAGEHFVTFSEDLSDLQEVVNSVDEATYNRISRNATDLFKQWIENPENLMNYILRTIHEVLDV
jgi:hypothetical protein